MLLRGGGSSLTLTVSHSLKLSHNKHDLNFIDLEKFKICERNIILRVTSFLHCGCERPTIFQRMSGRRAKKMENMMTGMRPWMIAVIAGSSSVMSFTKLESSASLSKSASP